MSNGYSTLPLVEWPKADREGWQAACQPAHRLKAGGLASSMASSSQRSHMRCYGYLMDFCKRTGRLMEDGQAASRIVPTVIEAFLEELKDRVGSVAQHIYISRIRRVTEILDPSRDFGWLRLIEFDLKHKIRRRPKADRIIDSRRPYTLGLDLMQRAEKSGHLTRLRRARLYREGLMIALLSVCPIRLANFASLQVGQHVRKINDQWWLLLPASETKSRRTDERPVPQTLTSYVERWLSHWRSQFLNPGTAFWVSTKGDRLAYTYVGTIISQVTLRELRVNVSPHLFRNSAVHTVATQRSDQMGVASSVLQHTDPRITALYDIKGRSILAGRLLQEIVNTMEPGKVT